LLKNVHHPVVLMARSGRNDVTARPKVGMVQSTARATATPEAHRELNRLRALRAVPDRVPTVLIGGVLVRGTVTVVIGSPYAAGGCCR